MKLLLDTHFVIWTLLGSRRLEAYPWLEQYEPWGISPASLLEIQFLAEVGRLQVKPRFFEALQQDERFVVDEPPFLAVVRHARALRWTRDPFDRLLAGHSIARKTPLCSVDRMVRRHHTLIAEELRA